MHSRPGDAEQGPQQGPRGGEDKAQNWQSWSGGARV